MTDKQTKYEDRLIDLALQEKLGGASPPDLTEKILNANGDEKHAVASNGTSRFWSQIVPVAIAMSISIALLTLSNVWGPKEIANHVDLRGGVNTNYEHFNDSTSMEHPVALPSASLAAPLTEAINGEGRSIRTLDDKYSRDTRGLISDYKRFESMRAEFQNAEDDLGVKWRDVESKGRNLQEDYGTMAYINELNPSARSELRAKLSNEIEDARRRTTELDTRHALAQTDFAARKRNDRLAEELKEYAASSWRLQRFESKLQEAIVLLDKVEKGIVDPREIEGFAQAETTPHSRFSDIIENPFEAVDKEPISTFSIDVDTASYSKVRDFLIQSGQLPPPNAVRIEELVNYFSYDYAAPKADDKHPFASHIEIAKCPWNDKHELVRIGIKGRVIEQDKRPASNLVFLIDVSGSMDQPNKLPLVIEGMKMLVGQLNENDRVAIVIYASQTGVRLEATAGDQHIKIRDVLDELRAQGSTNGGEGIRRAYQIALDNFIKEGVNRVILCTDGDFNVGTTGTDDLVRLAEDNAKAGVYLSILGFGMDNHNDAMLEAVSNKANGNYAFIDNVLEARKVLVDQMSGTLVTIAKDVKIQVIFNPRRVASYRLIGYENRMLATEDFDDDKKDAGEIGAGHTVTALYEIEPAELKAEPANKADDDDKDSKDNDIKDNRFLTLRLRYKQPDADKSELIEFASTDKSKQFTAASQDFQFTSAVASFGMLLRGSKFKGDTSFAAVKEIATGAKGVDRFGYRVEFVELVEQAKTLSGQ